MYAVPETMTKEQIDRELIVLAELSQRGVWTATDQARWYALNEVHLRRARAANPNGI